MTEYSHVGAARGAVADGEPRALANGGWDQGIRLEALANLAHELRSPVQALLGYLEMLRDEMADDLSGQQRQIVDRMNVNMHDLSRTVENLLEFALADAHAESTIEQNLTVEDLMTEVWPSLEAANLGKELAIEVRIDASVGKLHLRYRLLKSIVMNLAVNAIKFTAKGSVLISFKRVSLPDFPNALELTVSDTGPGIEQAMVERAFERCTQLSNSSARRYRGMGLGLPVVKHNVDLLGATLTVQSEPNLGSMFRVTIPLCGAANVAANPQIAMPILLSDPVSNGSKDER